MGFASPLFPFKPPDKLGKVQGGSRGTYWGSLNENEKNVRDW